MTSGEPLSGGEGIAGLDEVAEKKNLEREEGVAQDEGRIHLYQGNWREAKKAGFVGGRRAKNFLVFAQGRRHRCF